jgi:hypothetical protein
MQQHNSLPDMNKVVCGQSFSAKDAEESRNRILMNFDNLVRQFRMTLTPRTVSCCAGEGIQG